MTVSLSFLFLAGCILHTLNGKSSFGLNLSGIEDYLSSPDHYPLTLVFKQHGHEDVKGRKKFTVCLKAKCHVHIHNFTICRCGALNL